MHRSDLDDDEGQYKKINESEYSTELAAATPAQKRKRCLIITILIGVFIAGGIILGIVLYSTSGGSGGLTSLNRYTSSSLVSEDHLRTMVLNKTSSGMPSVFPFHNEL